MISNERPSPFRPRHFGGGPRKSGPSHGHSHGQGQSHGPGQGQGGPEETLKTEKLQIERKTFILTFKENPRGRFVRITEDCNGRRDTIIIPSTGLEDLRNTLEEFIRIEKERDATPPDPMA